MSTHNICFCREIRKIICGYPLLSVAMNNYNLIPNRTIFGSGCPHVATPLSQTQKDEGPYQPVFVQSDQNFCCLLAEYSD